MKSANTVLILSLMTILMGCSSHKPRPAVIVGTGEMYERWHDAVLQKCTDKAAEVTWALVVKKSKEGMVFAEEDIINIHKYLTEKCSMNSGIVI